MKYQIKLWFVCLLKNKLYYQVKYEVDNKLRPILNKIWNMHCLAIDSIIANAHFVFSSKEYQIK